MPELPEVETVARSLRARIVGRLVKSIEASGHHLRRPIDVNAMTAGFVGDRIEAVDRIGKYLLVVFSRGHVLVAHLGMSGHFAYAAAVPGHRPKRAPHTHVVFVLDGGDELHYVDARRFGVLATSPRASLHQSRELANLGVDPLTEAFTQAFLDEQLRTSGRDIKQFLLDQTRIAGLGNIYVAEALHVAAISPRRRADRLGSVRARRLHAAIVEVLLASVERRGTTLRDYVDADGSFGDNQNHLLVYGRAGQPCRRCAAPIRRLVQGARSTFYCPGCQK